MSDSEVKSAPSYLLPTLGSMPVSSAQHYTTINLIEMWTPPESAPADATVSTEGNASRLGQQKHPRLLSTEEQAPLRPAIGVVLHHEQAWHNRGVTLGRLLNTVCLAPGEVTQIAISKTVRETSGSRRDSVRGSQTVSQSENQSSALQEAQRAVASEVQGGRSVSTSSASHGQAGASGLLGGVGLSMSGSFNSAGSTSFGYSQGSRNAAITANQSLHQMGVKHSRSARTQSRVTVSEISELESSELSSRVVANYNHMHALTIEYFEVMQVYSLETRVVDAERCIFIPMDLIDFSAELSSNRETFVKGGAVQRFRIPLSNAADSFGYPGIAQALRELDHSDTNATQGESDNPVPESELANTESVIAALQTDLDEQMDSLLEAKDSMRIIGDSLRDRARLQRTIARAAKEVERLRIEMREKRSELQELRWQMQLQAESKRRSDLSANLDAKQIERHLTKNRLAYNQAIWAQLSPNDVAGMVKGKTFRGESIAATLDPRPIAIDGRYVAFRWAEESGDYADKFVTKAGKEPPPSNMVALPSDGVFAEAVLGVSNGAEKIDLSRFWNWHEALPPLLPPDIAPIGEANQRGAAPTKGANAPSNLSATPFEFAQQKSGLTDSLNLVGAAGLFKDFGTSKLGGKLAQAAAQHAKDGAGNAGDMANENYKRFVDLQRVVVKMVADEDIDPTMIGAAMNSKAKALKPNEKAGDG